MLQKSTIITISLYGEQSHYILAWYTYMDSFNIRRNGFEINLKTRTRTQPITFDGNSH